MNYEDIEWGIIPEANRPPAEFPEHWEEAFTVSHARDEVAESIHGPEAGTVVEVRTAKSYIRVPLRMRLKLWWMRLWMTERERQIMDLLDEMLDRQVFGIEDLAEYGQQVSDREPLEKDPFA